MKNLKHLVVVALCLATPVFAAPATHAKPKPLVGKHIAWSNAVTSLEKTKKDLLADKMPDVQGHKQRALNDIEKAMQELREVTQGEKH